MCRIRPPQKWALLAPLLREKERIDDSDKGVNFAAFGLNYDTKSINAFGKLFEPTTCAKKTCSSLQPLNLSPPRPSSRLENLASELLWIILSYLDERDTIALGLCSQTLWEHAHSVVQTGHRRVAGMWARTPIICTGTHLRDLPTAIYEIAPEAKPPPPVHHWPRDPMPRKWNDAARTNFDDVGPRDPGRRFFRAFEKHFPISGIRAELEAPLRTSLLAEMPDEDRRKEWRLRNLSTKEYVSLVRATGTHAEYGAVLAVQGVPWLTLDVLVLLRISWTRLVVTRRGMPHGAHHATIGQRVRNGCWAGHALDIVYEMTTSDGMEMEWSDVTGKVVAEAAQWETCWLRYHGWIPSSYSPLTISLPQRDELLSTFVGSEKKEEPWHLFKSDPLGF
jgi:hypothetical protein